MYFDSNEGQNPGDVCDTSSNNNFGFTIDCLSSAKQVTMGSWTTPAEKGLSHLTFYNGEIENPEDPEEPTSVPEPSVVFGLAFIVGSIKLSSRIKTA